MKYEVKKGQLEYGKYIGIILMDIFMPFPPGCPANASTFQYSVAYEKISGADISSLIYKKDKNLLDEFVSAGWKLIQKGVKAITGNCGFMILFQNELANEFPVPVFISSLLQISFISKIIKQQDKIGIIATHSNKLTPEMIDIAAGNLPNSIVIAGMENQKNFVETVHKEKGTMDFFKIQDEVIKVSSDLIKKNPDIKILVFECTDLCPFSYSVQQKLGLPIFDFTTMIDFVFASLNRKIFNGFI